MSTARPKPVRKRNILPFVAPEPPPVAPPMRWLDFVVSPSRKERRVRVTYFDPAAAGQVQPKPHQIPCATSTGALWLIEYVAPRPRLAAL